MGNTASNLEGNYSVYTDAGLIAFGVSLERARKIAGKIKFGSAKIATTAGVVVAKVAE